MNPIRFFRQLLLMLFVLLQCLAPLAHAHAGNGHGGHADRHVHIAATDVELLNGHGYGDQADAVHLSQGNHHAAVVLMPPEYRCSLLVIGEPAITGKPGMFAQREHDAVVFDSAQQRIFLPLPYQHPDSQAPPV